MIAYRVEDLETSQGPYRRFVECYSDSCAVCFEGDSHIEDTLRYDHGYGDHDHPAWPTFVSDITPLMLAGFQSIEDLKVWFNDYLDALHEQGYVIGVYETDTAMSYYCHFGAFAYDERVFGNRQLIFVGKKISHLPLTD